MDLMAARSPPNFLENRMAKKPMSKPMKSPTMGGAVPKGSMGKTMKPAKSKKG